MSDYPNPLSFLSWTLTLYGYKDIKIRLYEKLFGGHLMFTNNTVLEMTRLQFDLAFPGRRMMIYGINVTIIGKKTIGNIGGLLKISTGGNHYELKVNFPDCGSKLGLDFMKDYLVGA